MCVYGAHFATFYDFSIGSWNCSDSGVAFFGFLYPMFLLQIDGVFINNGHDLSLTINDSKENPFYMTGGPLSYKYKLFDVKLHFGEDNNKGSEHSIGGKRFPLEVCI